MKAKYFYILCVFVFWIVVAFLASWLDRVPVSAQEKGEYPRQEMTFTVNSEKIDQDSVLVLFSTRGLLGLLKEYQAYCDTVTIGRWEYFSTPVMSDTTFRTWKKDSSLVKFSRKQYRIMPLFPEDFINWLENVKLK